MEEFIKQLLLDSGVPDTLDAEVYQQLVNDLSIRVGDVINKRLIEALTTEDAVIFETMIDDTPDDLPAMQQFIDSHVADKDQVIGAALLEFRTLYLGARA